MSDLGKAIRLRKILRRHRGTLVVAFDHALVLGPIPGTLDPAGQIQRFIDARADAVLLNLGNFRYFANASCDHTPPGLIARLDWTTAFNEAAKAGAHGFQTGLVVHPEEALAAGADAVICFLTVGSGDAEFERKEIERVGSLARDCERLGLPFIVESIARGKQVENPRDQKWLMLHTRIAAELGADIIKTENPLDVEALSTLVKACPIPVLVLGGSRTGSDEDVLKSVAEIMRAGAAGVFFGRNIFQSDNMPELLERVRLALASSTSARGSDL